MLSSGDVCGRAGDIVSVACLKHTVWGGGGVFNWMIICSFKNMLLKIVTIWNLRLLFTTFVFIQIIVTEIALSLLGFCLDFSSQYCTSYRVRRRRDQEDTPNQRYPDNKEKRSKEDKDTQNKHAEREMSTKEEKPMPCTPQKAKPVRATVDLGREKMLRPPVDKWKRQDDKDLREKRCFICGREGHIKKECPQFKGSPGMDTSYFDVYTDISRGISFVEFFTILVLFISLITNLIIQKDFVFKQVKSSRFQFWSFLNLKHLFLILLRGLWKSFGWLF